MRPDPQSRATVLALAGVLILLALSLVGGTIAQKAIATRPTGPTPVPSSTPAVPPSVAAETTATAPPVPAPTQAEVRPTVTVSLPTAIPRPPPPTLEPAATAPHPTSTTAPTLTSVPPIATPSPGIAHPSGARDIVIQMIEGGGMLPRLDTLAARFPAFTLFGDGTLVYHTRTGYYQTHLDEAAIQGLLTLATTDLHFFDLDPRYAQPSVYDAATTHVRLVAAGQDHQAEAQALGLVAEDQTAPPDAPRARLLRLVSALRALMSEDGSPYVPAAVTLYAEGGSPTAPADAAPAWPIPGMTLATLLEASSQGSATALRLTGSDAAAALAAAATPRPFLEAGRRYTVVAVPDGP